MDPARLTEAISAAAHSLAVDQVTAEVVAAFRASAIEPVLLKGPSFAGWLYPAEVLRPYADTDLLVAPAQQDAAAETLRSLGFSDGMAAAAEHERDDHSRTFHRRRSGRGDDEVDLHFTLAGARAGPQAVWSALTRELEDVQVAGTQVSVLTAPALALHVAWHAAQDSRDTDQPIADLRRALAVTEPQTWVAAASLAAELDGVAAFAAGLELLPEGDDLLGRLGLRGSSRPFERLRATSPPPMSLGLARLLDRGHRRGLAGELAREVFPTPAFMRLWSPVARRGNLGLAVAYLWRPFSLLIRLAPAVRAYLRARRPPDRPAHGQR